MAARCPQLASTSSAMSPAKFFLHSPNSDAGDSSEEEGDTLFTPPSLGHPSAMFSQMNSQFTFRYPAESSTLEIPVAQEQTRPSRPLSPVAPVFTPAAKLKQPQQHSYERPISGPSPALDLANASLEFDPFAASFSSYCDPQTSPLKQPSTGRDRPSLSRSPVTDYRLVTKARVYSPRFPNDHYLDSAFVRAFQLEDELGSGGYGFVMTARHRTEGYEVAVKFIIKAKVPENSWMDDEILGRVPTEILLLSLINHENIVKCIDVYEDELYFYLVQELHGTPWTSKRRTGVKRITAPGKMPSLVSSPPPLSASPSDTTVDSNFPDTPPQSTLHLPPHVQDTKADGYPDIQVTITSPAPRDRGLQPHGSSSPHPDALNIPVPLPLATPTPKGTHLEVVRPKFSRRPSHDLFECIEQSKHKRLSETQARYIFAQVVEAVWYLDRQGITHRDIKDENLVVDKDLRVKLIDFGSAVVADPTRPRPLYNLFYGTTAYAASEILRRKPYQAAPAEIWTLGVLLSYLLTGNSPFPTEQDAIEGRILLNDGTKKGQASGEKKKLWISDGCLGLMRRCLEKDPERRATIEEVREHWWVRGAWEAWEGRIRR